MRTSLKTTVRANIIRPLHTRPLSILPILFIVGIGVQTFTSCSGDDSGDDPSSNSGSGISSSGGGIAKSSSSSRPGSSSSAKSSSSSGGLSACQDGIVTIGSQVWQKCNSNAVPAAGMGNSRCYNNDDSNCAIYGRLYDWSAAMALPSECNSTTCSSQIGAKHRGICPSGWHLPSDAEWDALMTSVGGSSTAGTKLKSASGWNTGSGYIPGTDDYVFSALPGGGGHSGGSFGSVGNFGFWWSATEYNASSAYHRSMYYGNASVGRYDDDKANLYSVRCVQD